MSEDLFPKFSMPHAEREGWQRRCLREMEAAGGSAVCCFPGFMGAFHEGLVEKGLASKETLGPRPMPGDWPYGKKDWAERAGMQHRYTLTDAGRAQLTRWRDAQG